jgi:hypothetical protein
MQTGNSGPGFNLPLEILKAKVAQGGAPASKVAAHALGEGEALTAFEASSPPSGTNGDSAAGGLSQTEANGSPEKANGATNGTNGHHAPPNGSYNSPKAGPDGTNRVGSSSTGPRPGSKSLLRCGPESRLALLARQVHSYRTGLVTAASTPPSSVF